MDTLNPKQLEAVHHKNGPLLIIAGAGTGKTKVITQRIAWLIQEKLAKPEEILALTFADKAAIEMQERVDQIMPYGYTQMSISTFHSFCEKLLRSEGLNIGLDTGFKLLSVTDAIDLFAKNLFKFKLDYYRPLGNPNKFISALLTHFSRLADEDVSPDQYLEFEKNELSESYKQWSDLKIEKSYMEFGDVISYAIRLLRKKPYKKFKYILVDEFQDTNYSQNLLVNLLVNENQNLTVVADDDQAIYRWRGASFSNVVQFRKNYPTAKLVTLNQNYRSTQEILDRSYDLIQHNNPDRLEIKEKIDKKLKSISVQGEKVEFMHFDRVDSEALGVIQKIQELGVDYKDVAILVRANNHAEPFIKAFEEHGIPFQFLGPGQLFYQPEIKDLISFLKVLVDLYDNASFYRVLAMPVWGITGREIVELSSIAKKENISLFVAAEKSEVESIKIAMAVFLRHLDMVNTQSAGKILYSFLKDSKFMTHVLDEKKIINITKFFDKIKLYEMTHEEISTRDVLSWINLSMQLGESPLVNSMDWASNDAVNILTVHSAKGLEFKVVFIVNLVSLRFPSTERKEPIPIPEALIKEELPEGDFHLQEERRLFYVAMTRARERLFLTASDLYGDGKREKKISPFVEECKAVRIEQTTAPIQEVTSDKVTSDKVVVNYLSYSQIQTFLDCPLHYKAKYILKIPTPQTASQSFGSSIHLVMKEYYENPKNNLLDLLKKNWIKEGYDTVEHEQLFFKKGEKFLREYQKENTSKILMLEQPFMVPLSYQNKFLRIGGKIDRVDELPDGTIEIIDYKTGAHPMTQKEADKNLQLSIYALAANALNIGQEIKLSLYYFEDQTKVTTTRTSDQLEAAVAEIFGVAKQIETSDFKCSGGFYCQNCEFQMLCDIGN